MRNRAVLSIEDIDDAKAADQTGVERLTARGGVERGPIQRDDHSVAVPLDALDRRFELAEIWVEVVQTIGHRGFMVQGSTLNPLLNRLTAGDSPVTTAFHRHCGGQLEE